MYHMTTALRPRTFILFAGDLFFFIFSLWLSLYLRAFVVPSQALFLQHLAPFSLLFVAWVIVFFIAGLYESRSIILERRALSATLLTTQVVNVAIAALFFFLCRCSALRRRPCLSSISSFRSCSSFFGAPCFFHIFAAHRERHRRRRGWGNRRIN